MTGTYVSRLTILYLGTYITLHYILYLGTYITLHYILYLGTDISTPALTLFPYTASIANIRAVFSYNGSVRSVVTKAESIISITIGIIVHVRATPYKKKKVGGKRYEVRNRGRSSPHTLAF